MSLDTVLFVCLCVCLEPATSTVFYRVAVLCLAEKILPVRCGTSDAVKTAARRNSWVWTIQPTRLKTATLSSSNTLGQQTEHRYAAATTNSTSNTYTAAAAHSSAAHSSNNTQEQHTTTHDILNKHNNKHNSTQQCQLQTAPTNSSKPQHTQQHQHTASKTPSLRTPPLLCRPPVHALPSHRLPPRWNGSCRSHTH